jgi:hypothetical protein
MYDLSQLQERFRGALLGGAIGDALGAPFEGGAAALQFDMAIGLAESLLARGSFDGAHLDATL